MLDRRTMIAAGIATAGIAAKPAFGARKGATQWHFPEGFLWGAATAPHQTEGNNVASDMWFLENQQPTIFAEPSRDACNSFAFWETDLDLVRNMGLNTYRFGIEWARIEPEKGLFSQAMLDHYKAVVVGCRQRGLAPIITMNHFSSPRWFSADGGWTNRESATLFARYCDRVIRTLGEGVHSVITLNEPNILLLLKPTLPQQVWDIQKLTLETAARRLGVKKFVTTNVAELADLPALQQGMAAAHRAGKAAIKDVFPHMAVGLSLAMMDDQAIGENSIRDRMRAELYGNWLEIARTDDFIGVQNYERAMWDNKGRLPAPTGSIVNWGGIEVWAPSLAGAVRFAHQATGVPVMVSEHGVGTDDDRIRAKFIPDALAGLKKTIDDGVPVVGYCHWSLLDNFEWIFGYGPKFGLHSVDPVTFARKAKPSATIYGAIARRSAV